MLILLWQYRIFFIFQEKLSESGPGQEYNDIAAAAQSLQPKGYTLETTEVTIYSRHF